MIDVNYNRIRMERPDLQAFTKGNTAFHKLNRKLVTVLQALPLDVCLTEKALVCNFQCAWSAAEHLRKRRGMVFSFDVKTFAGELKKLGNNLFDLPIVMAMVRTICYCTSENYGMHYYADEIAKMYRNSGMWDWLFPEFEDLVHQYKGCFLLNKGLPPVKKSDAAEKEKAKSEKRIKDLEAEREVLLAKVEALNGQLEALTRENESLRMSEDGAISKEEIIQMAQDFVNKHNDVSLAKMQIFLMQILGPSYAAKIYGIERRSFIFDADKISLFDIHDNNNVNTK